MPATEVQRRHHSDKSSQVFDGALIDIRGADTPAGRVATVQAIIDTAAAQGKAFAIVPDRLLPYTASSVTFNSAVQLMRRYTSRNEFDVAAYGAATDGSVDATASVNGANAAAIAAGGLLCGSPGSTYLVSGALTAWQTDFDFRGCTFTVENNPAIALTVGTTSVLRALTGFFPRINNDDHTVGWASEGTGVKLLNLLSCELHVPRIAHFAVGLHAQGTALGLAYNTVHIGELYNNKVNLRLKPGDGVGWVNQNTFIGGRYTIESAEGTNIAGARHIELAPFDATATTIGSWPNNNAFLNPSVEGDGPEFHLEIAGQYNLFLAPRGEASPHKVRFTGHATSATTYDNIIVGGYQVSESATFSSAGVIRQNHVLGGRRGSHQVNGTAGIRMSNLTSNANAILSFFPSTTPPEEIADTATTWMMRLSPQTLKGKRTGDTDSRIYVDFNNGRLYFGDATNTPNQYIDRANGGLRVINDTLTSVIAGNAVSADNGDAAATLTVAASANTQVWDTPITADRAVTLSTSLAVNGFKFRIVRTANCTGAFNLNVGTGPLKALGSAGTWCEVEYNGTAWVLTAAGSL